MPRYKCKAKDMEGNVYKGVMEAADERVLLKVLRDKGLYCFECRGLDSGMALRPAKIKHKLLPPLCRQLSAMLAAGVPLSRITGTGLFDKVVRIKYEVPNDQLQKLDDMIGEIDTELDALSA